MRRLFGLHASLWILPAAVLIAAVIAGYMIGNKGPEGTGAETHGFIYARFTLAKAQRFTADPARPITVRQSLAGGRLGAELRQSAELRRSGGAKSDL